MTDIASERPRPILAPLGGLYAAFGDGVETLLRVAAGLLLTVHGYGKILDPFAASGMVESLGFYPGAFWSPLLAVTEFFGGMLIAVGLLTRPAALAAAIVLAVTVYFHGAVQGEGLMGAEKSILWMLIMVFFVVRGANAHSVDARIGRQF